ncbi:MAG: Hsp70 family protein, partial [Syntrophomonadaceae bacterium]|nr:Hsp70 family protein [Syntrophomonadaceae bacterium]
VFTRIIEKNATIPTAKSQVFTTAADNQPSVDIHVLQGERKMAGDNVTLGRFQLTGIPPAPRGIPQIEVKFDIDVNGIVNVTAKDLASNKEQKITITSSSGLSDEEIENMVKNAEQYAAEDEERFKKVEAKNTADSLIYQADKTLKDFADKIDDEEKSKIESARDDLKQVMESDNVDEINSKIEALTQEIHAVAAKMYENTNQQEGSAGPEENDVYDAEYKVSDDKDNDK